ncbi:hypothetical protein ACSX1A_13825 [Pontibacter sp. MBLB2868]|uniref:hypothetical protein n=1 Tax=Pontibacter sp. MBLB2868 TaxID=3451555 RepID=UPI003F74E866
MENFAVKSVFIGALGALLMNFTSKEQEQVEPLAASEVKYFGTSPESCEIIEFDAENGNISGSGSITTLYSQSTPVTVSAQVRSKGGTYENTASAVLFDTSSPQGKYRKFRTPNPDAIRPMGNILAAGKANGKDVAIYEQGSRLELDFSAMGSITLKGIHVLDITEDEANSKLEMLDSSGKVIKTLKLPVTGAYGATRLNTENTPGVVKVRITFESKNKGGSGAIDVIEFCRS